MAPTIITVVGLILVALISLAGTLLTTRNDRALSHQEVDLPKKLDPESRAAKDLSLVIEAGVNRWYKKYYKPVVATSDRKPVARQRTVARADSVVTVAASILAVVTITMDIMGNR
jgi:hypothetical protein